MTDTVSTNIIITNPDTAREQAEAIAANIAQIKSVKSSIEYILKELAEYWEQTQQDAQAFSGELTKNAEKLDVIISCNTEFAENMVSYISATEQISSNITEGGTIA